MHFWVSGLHYALSIVRALDPQSTGRGVRQFKTSLCNRLTRITHPGPAALVELRDYFVNYMRSAASDRVRTCMVLLSIMKQEQLETVLDQEIIEELAERHRAYNILPLGPDSADKPIRRLPEDVKGQDVELSKYRGKVLLIVNVASQCGFTNSNYPELTTLYQKYKDQGLEVLAFPCNQFGGQEPGSNEEIQEFACTRFKAEYPVFSKVNVNGKDADPLYKFLKSSKKGFLGDSIKWNFTKFLVDREGNVVERYAPTTSPLSIEKDIKKLLNVA